MSDSNGSSTVTGGISFGGMLFIAFLVLKLTHVIEWSWWLVTMPLWMGWVVLLLALILAATLWGSYKIINSIRSK